VNTNGSGVASTVLTTNATARRLRQPRLLRQPAGPPPQAPARLPAASSSTSPDLRS
jgi:hypothetical protein